MATQRLSYASMPWVLLNALVWVQLQPCGPIGELSLGEGYAPAPNILSYWVPAHRVQFVIGLPRGTGDYDCSSVLVGGRFFKVIGTPAELSCILSGGGQKCVKHEDQTSGP